MARVRMRLRVPGSTGTRTSPLGRASLWPHHRSVLDDTVILPTPFDVDLGRDGADPIVELAPGLWWCEEHVPDGEKRLVRVPADHEAINAPVLSYAELIDIDPDTVEPIGPTPAQRWEAELDAATALATQEAEGHAEDAGREARAASGSALTAAESVRLASAEVANAKAQVDLAKAEVRLAAAEVVLAKAEVGNAARYAGDADTARAAAVAAQQGATTAREAIDQLRPTLTVGGLVIGQDLVLRSADGAEAVAGRVVPRVLGGVASRLPFGSEPVVAVRQDGLDFSLDVGVPDGQPGGLPVAQPLPGGSDLNTVVADGQYRVTGNPVNGPPNSTIGALHVLIRQGTDRVVQIFYPQAGTTAGDGRRFYMRTSYSGNPMLWTSWRTYASQRIDSPAGNPGIGVYTWDDVNGAELQLAGTGMLLGTASLDDVMTAGTYRQPNAPDATAARKYPQAGTTGVLEVVCIPASPAHFNYLQRYTVTGGTSAHVRGYYQRRRNTSTSAWDEWRFVSTQRIDKSAGLAFYTWDDVAGREQLGSTPDTGYREVKSLVEGGWTATSIIVRRLGYLVELMFAGLDPTAQTSSRLLTIPSGFRPGGSRVLALAMRPATGNTSLWTQVQGSGAVLGQTGSASHGTYSGIVYTTNDAWPSSLPGDPSGNIPNV